MNLKYRAGPVLMIKVPTVLRLVPSRRSYGGIHKIDDR